MTKPDNKSLITELWNRRVPQFVANYVGICWGILQFLIFATNRYQLDNGFIDKFLIFAVVLIPGVFVYTYNHGRPGKDEWKQYEKILLPVNLVLALVFAGIFSPGNEMNAAPIEVQVTNEQGDTVTRIVPSAAQAKSFGIFPFKDNTESSEDDWMKFAFGQLIVRDMEQDMRMYCVSPFGFEYSFKSNNASIYDNDISFGKYLKIAKDRTTDYFVLGEFSKEEAGLAASIEVYDSNSGELFFENNYNAESIFDIVDQFTAEMSSNLFIDDSSNKVVVTDLPAKDLITKDLEALEMLMNAKIKHRYENEYLEAIEIMKSAIALDPESPMLKSYIAAYYNSIAKVDSSKIFIDEAVELSEFLPERQNFKIRQEYYIFNQQIDKNIALLETWRQLYPRDYYPYNQLLEFYSLTQVFNKAKKVGEDALENGHSKRVLKRLATFEIAQNNLDKAEEYINRYYELFPDKNKMEDTQLAEIYLKKGEFEKAKEWYESILLLNPNDYKINLKLSDVYTQQGDLREAEKMKYEALSKVKLVEDSIAIYQNLIFFYYRAGNVDKFMEVAQKHFDALTPKGPPVGSAFQHLSLIGVYASMSQYERIDEIAGIVKT
jgi:tetratricopeptide (TPR) repeat protein